MKSQLRLLNCILIIALSSFFQFANAQIVYTDVNPDQTYSGGSYNLDLNNDGTNDFTVTDTLVMVTITCGGGCGSGQCYKRTLEITPVGNNEIGLDSGSSKLDQNTLIDSSSISWSNFITTMAQSSCTGGTCVYNWCLSNGPSWSGYWVEGDTDKYLGLRIHVSSQTYYGWVRLDVANLAASFTIKDYAYKSIADQSILAGDTNAIALGISYAARQYDFSAFPNPASNKITLSFSSTEKKEIQITNTLGQIVFAEEINSAKQEIDVSEFPAGVYVMSAQTSTQKVEKKFLKQ